MRAVRLLLTGGLVGLGVLVMGLFAFSKVEENDSFCASCHTQPESTYVARANAAAPVDLASQHRVAAPTVRCIDCHAEPGVSGRVGAMMLGAHDALRWVAGTARQPSITTAPLSDATCLQCHAEVTQQPGFDHHYHRTLTEWQRTDPAATGCTGCHTAHTTGGAASAGFLRQQRTLQTCDACHTALVIPR
jgi:hypothetical protein